MSTYDKVILLPRKPQNPKDFHDLQDILNGKIDEHISKAFGEVFRFPGANVTVDSAKIIHIDGYYYLGNKLFYLNQQADMSGMIAANGGSPIFNVYVDVTEEEITFEQDPSIALQMPNTGQYVETSVRHQYNAQLVVPTDSEEPHQAPADGWTYLIAQANVDTQDVTDYTHMLTLFVPEATEIVKKVYFELTDSNGDTYLTSTNAIDVNPTLHKFFTQGLLDYGDGAGDRQIITEPLPPKPPINIRIKNIEFLSTEVDEAELQFLGHDYQHQVLPSATVRVTLGWGYDDVVGTGNADGSIDATNLTDIIADQLVGYQATINGLLYKIVSNDATDSNGITHIEVRDELNIAPDLSGSNFTIDNPVYIHPAAQTYIVRAIPYRDNSLRPERAYVYTIPATKGADGLSGTFALPVNMKYLFQVRAININKTCDWTDMPAGSWTDQSGTTYDYDSPTLIKLPNLPDDGTTTVLFSPSKNGLLVDVNGWSDAVELEYGWKILKDGDNTSIDFQNPSPSTTIKRTTMRHFEIVINDPSRVSVAIRPLQAGQVVGTTHSDIINAGGLAPSKPLNVHIHDVRPIDQTIDTTMINKIARGQNINQVDKKVNVIVKWGYTSRDGVGSYNDTDHGMILLHDLPNIQNGELVDQLIYVENLHKSYYIWKNNTSSGSDTLLFIRNIDNTEATDAASIIIDQNNSAVIYPDADSYTVEAYESYGGEIIQEGGPFATSQSSMRIGNIIPNAINIQLPLGKTFQIFVKAIKDKRISDAAQLAAGSLTRIYQGSLLETTNGDVKTYDYSSDFLVKMIDFVDTQYDNGQVNGAATYTGFKLTISGWDFASAFEIGYAQNGYIDFNNPGNGQIVISASRNIDIPTTQGGTYFVTVRPLDGWQVSGTPANIQTAAGSGGTLPMEQVILAKDVDLVTYHGTFEFIDPGVSPDYETLGRLLDSDSQPIKDPHLKGKILTDANDHDFRIISIDSEGVITAVPLNNGAYAVANGDATVGTSKNGRRIYYAYNMNIDYRITRIAFVCDSIKIGPNDTPGTIRIYQKTRESSADYITFQATGSFGQETDVDVIAAHGVRDLIVDAYNPDKGGTKTQLTSFSGQLTIYGIPRKIVEY